MLFSVIQIDHSTRNRRLSRGSKKTKGALNYGLLVPRLGAFGAELRERATPTTARQRTSFAAARFEFLLLFSDARVRLDPRGNDGVATATARRAWILRPGIIVWFPTVSLHQQFTLKIVNRRGEVPERPALALEVDGKTSGATGRSTSARACLGQPLPLCLAACSST